MAAPIGKGDWVQCVEAGDLGQPGRWAPEDVITVGDVYVVDECFINERTGRPNVTLAGKGRRGASERLGFRAGYDVRRFRPLGGNAKSLKAPPIRVRKTENA